MSDDVIIKNEVMNDGMPLHSGPAIFKSNFQAGSFLDNKDRRTKD